MSARLGVSGTIENDSSIDKELYDEIVNELVNGKKLILQAAQVIREQRELIEKLKEEIDRGKSREAKVPT